MILDFHFNDKLIKCKLKNSHIGSLKQVENTVLLVLVGVGIYIKLYYLVLKALIFLKRVTLTQIWQGKAQLVYLADFGQATYEIQRIGLFNNISVGAIVSFVDWIENKTFNNR